MYTTYNAYCLYIIKACAPYNVCPRERGMSVSPISLVVFDTIKDDLIRVMTIVAQVCDVAPEPFFI